MITSDRLALFVGVALAILTVIGAISVLTIVVMSWRRRHRTPVFVEDTQLVRKTLTEPGARFFAGLSVADLAARSVHAKDGADYRNFVCQNVQTFTPTEKETLLRLCRTIDIVTIKACPCVYRLPWKLCKVSTRVEGGYPHTLGETIFLSSDFFGRNETAMAHTLLHEQIHVFQRCHPKETQAFYRKMWKMTTMVTHDELREAGLLVRSNPDVDGMAYSVPGKPDSYIVQLYTSDTPSSLADSRPCIVQRKGDAWEVSLVHVSPDDLGVPSHIHQLEHPNEIMAGLVPRLILQNERCATPWCTTTLTFIQKN